MDEAPYIFPPSQTEYMRALGKGLIRTCPLSRRHLARVSLKDRMPPVYQQAVRGTCVAAAVTALLEYYEDCKTRLSIQYLHEVTKELDTAWLERNLASLSESGTADAEFCAVFRRQTDQIRSVAAANGADSPAVRAFVKALAESLAANKNLKGGCLIRRCFEAVETRGVCRYSIWPYANMQVTQMFGGTASAAEYPPGAHEDACKHRVLSGLYLLRAPNNVDEMRGILSGANGRRPMPVCAGLAIFEGCSENGRFDFPEAEERDGRLVSKNAFKGGHEVLLVGYEDDPAEKGGGRFILRNSWGEEWGDGGYGTVSYAYVECFCNEAGTILQNVVDYVGDGYNGLHTVPELDAQGGLKRHKQNKEAETTEKGRSMWLAVVVAATVAAAVAWTAAKFF
jgi:hypothetical protein